jgi:hypothetical protein
MTPCESCVNSGFMLMGHAAGMHKGWVLIEKCDECGVYESDWDAGALNFVDCRQDQNGDGIRVAVRVRSANVPIEILKLKHDKAFGWLVTNWYAAGGGVYRTVAEARKAHGSNWILIPPRLQDVIMHCKANDILWFAAE